MIRSAAGAILQRLFARSQFYQNFFGPGHAETGSIYLRQNRVYILPTRPGLAFCAALAVMLIGSINYNLSLGYILTFLLASMGLVAMLHTFRNLVHLRISPGRVEPVFAGDGAWFELFLENRAAYERCSIVLRYQGSTTPGDVASGRGTTLSIPAQTHRRGWLALERVTVETRFPLGLLRAWSYVKPDMRCLVYPKPDQAMLPLPEAATGLGAKRTAGGGSDDFSGLRAYQSGDSPRHIHWKAAAREQGLRTKVFSGSAAAELWLDWTLVPGELGVESRLSRLTRWVLAADQAGLRYGLRLPGLELPPATGEGHRLACLRALALHGLES